MSLLVTEVKLRDFRNYDRFELTPAAGLTILVGPNAVGKTNLVEALQLLTRAESFRRPLWGQVVRWGADTALLTLSAEGDGRVLEEELEVHADGKKAFLVNGKPKRRLSDIAGLLPSVMFTPDDLSLVKDSAEKRRAALDSLGTQLSQTYGRLRTSYDRVLRQRNALLKDESADEALLSPLDDQLIDLGSRLVDSRRRLFDRVAAQLSAAHEVVSGSSDLEARYVVSWDRNQSTGEPEDSRTALARYLASRKADERARRTTLAGPHRDDIVFELKGRDARFFASQGQQRTIALSWKMAEVAVIEEVAGQVPLLLLDDVMSELDASRRKALADMVGRVTQTIITTTNLGYFDEDLIERAKVVELR